MPLRPGTNVAIVNAIAHTIVSEGLEKTKFIEERCDVEGYKAWREFILDPQNSPEHVAEETGVDPEAVRGAARLFASVPNAAIYYGLGVTEHSQGSTTVMAIANLAMCTGNIGREGVGVNPLRGQNNVQGSLRHGLVPARAAGLPARVGSRRARAVRQGVGRGARSRTPACASRTCSTPRSRANSRRCTSKARTSRSPIPIRTT